MPRAFTLLDILITLLITSLLLALLLPALSPALATSRSLSCRSNLIQIRSHLLSYIEDYRTIPTYPESAPDSLRLFFDAPPTLFHCPADRSPRSPLSTSYTHPLLHLLPPFTVNARTPIPTSLPRPLPLMFDTAGRHPLSLRNAIRDDGTSITLPAILDTPDSDLP